MMSSSNNDASQTFFWAYPRTSPKLLARSRPFPCSEADGSRSRAPFRSVQHREPPGINGTEWIAINRPTYDACLDPNDYRPRKPHSNPDLT